MIITLYLGNQFLNSVFDCLQRAEKGLFVLFSFSITNSLCRYGAMGLLRTKDEWQGQGCAKACVQNLAMHLDSIGMDPYVYIEIGNDLSIQFFEKLGFTRDHDATWIYYVPNSN